MKTSATVALILATAVTSAGITWLATRGDTPPVVAAEQSADPASLESTLVSAPNADTTVNDNDEKTPWKGRDSTVAKEERDNTGPPAGIDAETWEQANRRVAMMTNFAEMARNSGWVEERMKQSVTSDATRINTQLGLEGESALKVEELLATRLEASTSRTMNLFDAMLSDKDGLTELMAMGEMAEGDNELSPELTARKEALKKQMFGEFYPESGTLSDEDLRDMFRPQRPADWYDDKDFVAAAAAELGGNEGTELQAYAEKMDYLDRERSAYSQINRLERNLALDPDQSQKLMQLYMDNPSPSDEDLGSILSAEQVQQVKESNQNDRRGDWGGRGGRGSRGGRGR